VRLCFTLRWEEDIKMGNEEVTGKKCSEFIWLIVVGSPECNNEYSGSVRDEVLD
jgi:hypothetical protein